jgi:hypothetical protein
MGKMVIQLLQNGDFESVGWWNVASAQYTVSEKEATIVKNTTTAAVSGLRKTISDLGLVVGHKYYYAGSIKTSSGRNCYVGFWQSNGVIESVFATSGSTYMKGAKIYELTSQPSHFGVRCNNSDTPSDTMNAKNIILIDLTMMFGAGNEPGLETCQEIFTEDYYPYNLTLCEFASISPIQRDLLLRRRWMISQFYPVQLVQNGNFIEGTNGWTDVDTNVISVTDGVLRLEKASSTFGRGAIFKNNTSGFITSHSYYMRGDVKSGSNKTSDSANICFTSTLNTLLGNDAITSTSGQWERIDQITSPKRNTDYFCVRTGAMASSSGSFAFFKNVILIDLTATYGSGNEPDLATCRDLFANDYYNYNSPSN